MRNEHNLVNMIGETNEGTLLFKQNNGMTYTTAIIFFVTIDTVKQQKLILM